MPVSFAPVAPDQACVDLCNRMPVIEDSCLGRHLKSFWKKDSHRDYFGMNFPDTDWEAGLQHAVEIGLSSRDYELIKI